MCPSSVSAETWGGMSFAAACPALETGIASPGGFWATTRGWVAQPRIIPTPKEHRSEPTAGSMALGSPLAALPAAVLRRPTWPTGRSSATAPQFPLRCGTSAPAGPSMTRGPTTGPRIFTPTDRGPIIPWGNFALPRPVSAKRFRTRTWHRQPVGPAHRGKAARTNPRATSALPASRPWGLAMDRLLEMPASPY